MIPPGAAVVIGTLLMTVVGAACGLAVSKLLGTNVSGASIAGDFACGFAGFVAGSMASLRRDADGHALAVVVALTIGVPACFEICRTWISRRARRSL